MKSAFEIAKEELKDFTDFPTVAKIIHCMDEYGKQCFLAGMLKNYKPYKNSLITPYNTYEEYTQMLNK